MGRKCRSWCSLKMWPADAEMSETKEKKRNREFELFIFLFSPSFNIVSFSHSAAGGRKGEKNGRQSWCRSICICNSSSQGEWDGCSPGLESLMAGQKDIPKHMDYTQMKNNYDFFPKKIFTCLGFFFSFSKSWFDFWGLVCFILFGFVLIKWFGFLTRLKLVKQASTSQNRWLQCRLNFSVKGDFDGQTVLSFPFP